MASVPYLTDEIVENMMFFMSYEDRKTARLVCRCWREISFSSRLIKSEVVKLPTYQDLQLLIEHGSKYFNIEIGDEEEENDCLNQTEAETAFEFWSKSGQYIKSLKMRLHSRCLSEVLPNLHNVVELTLWGLEIPIFPVTPFPFQNLLRLTIKYKILNGNNFRMLVENAPRLEELNLIRESSERNLIREPLIENFKLNRDLATFTKRQGSILKRLRFYKIGFDNDKLKKILANVGPQMLEFQLSAFTFLNDACVPIIRAKMPNLIKINLSFSTFTDNGIYNLLRGMKHLTHVDLMSAYAEYQTASVIATMTNLVFIDLTSAYSMNEQCIRIAFGSQRLPQLTELRLHENGLVNDKTLRKILPFLPNLKVLHLRSFNLLTAIGVRYISYFCQKLQVLSLTGCSGVKDISPLNELGDLKYLSLRGCEVDVSQLSLMKLEEIIVKNSLKGRHHLPSFQSLAVNCPSLQNVYIETDLAICGRNEKYSSGSGAYKLPQQLKNQVTIESASEHPFKIHHVSATDGPLWEKKRSVHPTHRKFSLMCEYLYF